MSYDFYESGLDSRYLKDCKNKYKILDKNEFKKLRISVRTTIHGNGNVSVILNITGSSADSALNIVIIDNHDRLKLAELFMTLDSLKILDCDGMRSQFDYDVGRLDWLRLTTEEISKYRNAILGIYMTLYNSVSEETKLRIELTGGVPWKTYEI